MALVIDTIYNQFNLFGQYFEAAIQLAVEILGTERYVLLLIDNISDTVKPTPAFVREPINAMHVGISVTEIGEHLDAYALVYRDSEPNKIFFNPLLLMQIALSEHTMPSNQHRNKCILFLAVKMVHEFSHLIHPRISAALCNQIVPKNQGGEGKRKRVTPEKDKPKTFQDFGEMIEFDILGGILELYTSESQPVAYRVDQLVLYAFPMARTGNLVRVPDDPYQANASLSSLRLPVFEEPVVKPYKGPRGHLGVSVRFFGAGNFPESDVISGDEEEGEGKSTSRLSPTF